MLLERWFLCFFVYAMLLKICCWKGGIFVSLFMPCCLSFAVGKVTFLFLYLLLERLRLCLFKQVLGIKMYSVNTINFVKKRSHHCL